MFLVGLGDEMLDGEVMPGSMCPVQGEVKGWGPLAWPEGVVSVSDGTPHIHTLASGGASCHRERQARIPK